MTPPAPETILWVFVYFCRIGGFLMVFPGYSSTRVPIRARLLVAVGTTLALAPMLLSAEGAAPPGATPDPARLLIIILSETAKGAAIGLMGRMFFLAFEFLASTAAMFAGMGNFPGMPAEGVEPVPALVSLITLTAVTMVFVTGMHMQALSALVDSYAVSPVGALREAGGALSGLVDALSAATFLAMQAISPFVVYAVVVNLAIGLVNRLTPQIPAYFISLPALMIGGLFLLYFILDEMFGVFLSGFSNWLLNG